MNNEEMELSRKREKQLKIGGDGSGPSIKKSNTLITKNLGKNDHKLSKAILSVKTT